MKKTIVTGITLLVLVPLFVFSASALKSHTSQSVNSQTISVADCYCNPADRIYWCIFGRSMMRTGVPCQPEIGNPIANDFLVSMKKFQDSRQ